ncbi:MAG: hypothetical protein COA91_02855 [Robiginitomaculum sp.]|nr:MAG: hypothetical protein COA91_02855 [Robiginitomaculum sp.]
MKPIKIETETRPYRAQRGKADRPSASFMFPGRAFWPSSPLVRRARAGVRPCALAVSETLRGEEGAQATDREMS